MTSERIYIRFIVLRYVITVLSTRFSPAPISRRHCVMSRGSLYFNRDLPTGCWLDTCSDFGCNRCERKLFMVEYWQWRGLRWTGSFLLGFGSWKQKVFKALTTSATERMLVDEFSSIRLSSLVPKSRCNGSEICLKRVPTFVSSVCSFCRKKYVACGLRDLGVSSVRRTWVVSVAKAPTITEATVYIRGRCCRSPLFLPLGCPLSTVAMLRSASSSSNGQLCVEFGSHSIPRVFFGRRR